jgi:hypothetical protein
MKPLEQIYKGGFFKNRYRLEWRAPIIVDAIVQVFNPKSVIDIGCAVGEVVKELRKRNIDAKGLEGSLSVKPFLLVPERDVLFHDLRKPLPQMDQKFDLAICFEVAEHIEEEHSDAFLDNLSSLSDVVLMSAAPPGQGGHHHVNCQESAYWEAKMSSRGYFPNWEACEEVRKSLITHRRREIKVIGQNLLCFRRSLH